MRKKLTKATLEMKTPASGRIEIADTDSPVTLRIGSDGRRALTLRTRFHGRQVRFTYPNAAIVENLTDARRWAHGVIDACRRGVDPREAERKKVETQDRNVFEAVYAEWLKRDQAANKSYLETKRSLDKDVLPRWQGRQVAGIVRRDVIELLDAIVDRGAPVHARRVHASLHRLFVWAIQRDIIALNPMQGLPKPSPDRSRDRVLADDELVRIWQAAGHFGYPFGPIVRTLILTGARRAEIAALQWHEVDLAAAAIHLPGTRTKSGQAHSIPLVPQAVAILNALPRFAASKGSPGYLFSTTHRTPVSGWSRVKNKLDTVAAMIDAAGRPLADPDPLAGWRLHDIRRTVATGLQRLGVRLEVTEAVLGHVSGSRAGVVGVYQRHNWKDEKRRALDAWARHVEALVEGREPAGNVVALPGGAGR